MKIITAILSILLLSGCVSIKDVDIKNITPLVNIYGESDYIYVRIGVMWGDVEKYILFLEEDDYIKGESNSKGSKGNRSSGGCSGGSCSTR